MAMTTCGECGGKVSTQAKTCPHCGAQLKGKAAGRVESVVKWAIAGVVLLLVLAMAWASVRDVDGGAGDTLNRDVDELLRRREQGQ
jgi:uncharacterized paraquat-inducible protein A